MKTSRPKSFAPPARKIFSGAKSPGLLALVLGATLWLGTARAAGPEVSENQVKAACLLNFPKYVDWPAEAFATTNSSIIFAIIGDAGLVSAFEKTIAGKTVNGRPIILTHGTSSTPDTNRCHILFISATARRTADLLGTVRGQPILTVSDDDAFLTQGGVIRLVRRDQKIRLEVNLAAATEAQLKISSKLLSVADVVKGGPK